MVKKVINGFNVVLCDDISLNEIKELLKTNECVIGITKSLNIINLSGENKYLQDKNKELQEESKKIKHAFFVNFEKEVVEVEKRNKDLQEENKELKKNKKYNLTEKQRNRLRVFSDCKRIITETKRHDHFKSELADKILNRIERYLEKKENE